MVFVYFLSCHFGRDFIAGIQGDHSEGNGTKNWGVFKFAQIKN